MRKIKAILTFLIFYKIHSSNPFSIRLYSIGTFQYIGKFSNQKDDTTNVTLVNDEAAVFDLEIIDGTSSLILYDKNSPKGQILQLDKEGYLVLIKKQEQIQPLDISLLPYESAYTIRINNTACLTIKNNRIQKGKCEDVKRDKNFHFCWETEKEKDLCKKKFSKDEKIESETKANQNIKEENRNSGKIQKTSTSKEKSASSQGPGNKKPPNENEEIKSRSDSSSSDIPPVFTSS